MVENRSGQMPNLLNEEGGGQPVPQGIAVIALAHLGLGQPHRQQLLNQCDAQPLLKGADNQQVGNVHPVVALLDRLRHDPGPDVVVDGGSRNELFLLELRRKIVQILLQKRDHLFHIQTEVRDLLPGGQPVLIQIGLPSPQLACDQLFVVRHTITSH